MLMEFISLKMFLIANNSTVIVYPELPDISIPAPSKAYHKPLLAVLMQSRNESVILRPAVLRWE